jgi:hypothetical protein
LGNYFPNGGNPSNLVTLNPEHVWHIRSDNFFFRVRISIFCGHCVIRIADEKPLLNYPRMTWPENGFALDKFFVARERCDLIWRNFVLWGKIVPITCRYTYACGVTRNFAIWGKIVPITCRYTLAVWPDWEKFCHLGKIVPISYACSVTRLREIL